MFIRNVIFIFMIFSFSDTIFAKSLEEKIKKYGSCYDDEIMVIQVNNLRRERGLPRERVNIQELRMAINDLLNQDIAPERKARLRKLLVKTNNCIDGGLKALAKLEASNRGEMSPSGISKSSSASGDSDDDGDEKEPNLHVGSRGQAEGQLIDEHGNQCITIKQVETTWVTARKEECYRTSQYGNCQDRVDNYQATNGCNQTISFTVRFNQPTWEKGGNIKPGGSIKFSCSYGGRGTQNCQNYSWSAKVN